MDLKAEYQMFIGAWKLYMHHVGCQDDNTWQAAIDDLNRFLQEHDTPFAKEMILIIWRQLERTAGIDVANISF